MLCSLFFFFCHSDTPCVFVCLDTLACSEYQTRPCVFDTPCMHFFFYTSLLSCGHALACSFAWTRLRVQSIKHALACSIRLACTSFFALLFFHADTPLRVRLPGHACVFRASNTPLRVRYTLQALFFFAHLFFQPCGHALACMHLLLFFFFS